MDRKFIEGKVSVIIPIYNAEKYLRKTLDSILVQTYKDIEIVLVDDCSNDDSANIIKEYIQKYPEIVYFLQETNQGAGAARNKALELATGQYVAFLDSDDIWYPNKVAKQLELMKKRNCPFSYTAIEMIDENDNLLKNKRNIKEKVNSLTESFSRYFGDDLTSDQPDIRELIFFNLCLTIIFYRCILWAYKQTVFNL